MSFWKGQCYAERMSQDPDPGLICEVEPGVFYDANPGATQDGQGVDLTLVDQTLTLSPDDRVRRLDAWTNSVRRLQAEIDANRQAD